MGSLKNVLLLCQEHERKYAEYAKRIFWYDKVFNQDRSRNQGWIEALQFVKEHFDIDFKTIKQKGD